MLKFCTETGIIPKTIDQRKLVNAIRKMKSSKQTLDSYCYNDDTNLPSKEKLEKSRRNSLSELFLEISDKAPIEAHEIATQSSGKLLSSSEKWFWLFYSVMDRRANAATFVRAKEALEKVDLFLPYKITELADKEGEDAALRRIARILRTAGFPLLCDQSKGDLAFPQSILDAARFVGKQNFNFNQLYDHYKKQTRTNEEARDLLWKDLQNEIYGVGPRIASQIIRGLVLKGSWDLPLNDDRFLEVCRFNVWIAGETRLGLVDRDSDYYKQLGEFADKYLNGNRGVLAHVLWYIRKRYCGRPPNCRECLLANYCKSAFSF
jgi:hypothetical protein